MNHRQTFKRFDAAMEALRQRRRPPVPVFAYRRMDNKLQTEPDGGLVFDNDEAWAAHFGADVICEVMPMERALAEIERNKLALLQDAEQI